MSAEVIKFPAGNIGGGTRRAEPATIIILPVIRIKRVSAAESALEMELLLDRFANAGKRKRRPKAPPSARPD